MQCIDTKTGDPWPSRWATAKLKELKDEASAELVARDRARGIAEDGQVYDMEKVKKGEHSRTQAIVNPHLAALRHTGQEVRLLTKSKWADWCSQPRDLQAFVASVKTSEAAAIESAKEAAAEIVESIPKEEAPKKTASKKTSKKVTADKE